MAEDREGEKVSVAEAARTLRLNREKIIRRIQNGEIAGGKILGVWYVQRAALDDFSRGTSRAASHGRGVR